MSRLSNPFNILVSTAPSYIAGMAVNEVRALTSVANGKANYEAAAPSEWTTPYPGPSFSNSGEGWGPVFHHIQELDSYSGGVGNPIDRIAYAHGGGHSSGCFAGFLGFDFKGTTQPTGFIYVPGTASSPASVAATNNPTDGRPPATHTYNMIVFDEVNRRFWRLGGGANMLGSCDSYDWYCAADGSSSGNPWTRNSIRPFNPASPGYDCTVYHRATNKVFYTCDNNSRFFNLSTRTWGSADFGMPSNNKYQMSNVYVPADANSGTVYHFGQGSQYCYKATINFVNETFGGWQAFSVSGDNGWLGGDMCAAFWDALLNVVWVFGSRGETYPNFYRWNPATGVSTQQTMTYTVSGGGSGSVMQGTPLGAGYAYGLGGRFVYMPDWRAVGIVTSYSRPAYIWKLPSS